MRSLRRQRRGSGKLASEVVPDGLMAPHFGHGQRFLIGADLVPRGDTQHRSLLERVDVVQEKGFAIGLEDGEHHALDADALVRPDPLGDGPEALVGHHRPVAVDPREIRRCHRRNPGHRCRRCRCGRRRFRRPIRLGNGGHRGARRRHRRRRRRWLGRRHLLRLGQRLGRRRPAGLGHRFDPCDGLL